MPTARERIRRGAAWCAALQLCCSLAGADDAGKGRSSGAARPEVTVLLPMQPGQDREDLRGAADRLKELPIEVSSLTFDTDSLGATIEHARTITRRGNVIGVLWIGEWNAERTLFLHETRADHSLARRVPRGANPAAEREELAIIVRGTVTALLEGAAPEMEEIAAPGPEPSKADEPSSVESRDTTPPPRAPLDEPRAPRATDTRSEASGAAGASRDTTRNAGFDLGIRAGYLGATRIIDVGTGWESGASVGVRLGLPFALHTDVSYGFLPATNVSVSGTKASFSRHPATLAVGTTLHAPVRPWRWLAAELTLAADRVTRSTTSTEPGLEPSPDDGRWLVSGGARVGAALEFAPRLSLFALLGAEAVTNPVHYVIENGDADVRFGVKPFGVKADVGILLDLVSMDSRSP